MSEINFQELFDAFKKTLSTENYKESKPSSEWLQMREDIKELWREMCFYDEEAWAMIILACYWSRYRSWWRNSKVDRNFLEYLKWIQENPGKTY